MKKIFTVQYLTDEGFYTEDEFSSMGSAREYAAKVRAAGQVVQNINETHEYRG